MGYRLFAEQNKMQTRLKGNPLNALSALNSTAEKEHM